MRKEYTPQEKKQKSLELDGRNCYGENSKSSRKAIPLRKALVNRVHRRTANQALMHPNNDVDVLDETVSRIKRGGWKKAPDAALADKLLNRVIRQIVNRITSGKDSAKLLADLESKLKSIGTQSKALQDILKQLRGIVRARHSIRNPLRSRLTPLKMDYDMATTILTILNRKKAKN